MLDGSARRHEPHRSGLVVTIRIYQLAHRGYVAVEGGAGDCPYTYMHDLVAGCYRLPWEDQVVHVDGTSCGFAPPTRRYAPAPPAPLKRTA
jgi:formamidase